MSYKIRNISLPSKAIIQADKEAKRLGLSFSAFIRLLLGQYFDGITFERKTDEGKNNRSQK